MVPVVVAVVGPHAAAVVVVAVAEALAAGSGVEDMDDVRGLRRKTRWQIPVVGKNTLCRIPPVHVT